MTVVLHGRAEPHRSPVTDHANGHCLARHGFMTCDEMTLMIARIASFVLGIVAPLALVGWVLFVH